MNTQIYKEFKNKNLTNQRIAERNYFQKQFDLQDCNMGKTFKVIRTLLDKDAGNNVSKSIDFVVNSCPPHYLSLFCSCGLTIWRNFLIIIDINKN